MDRDDALPSALRDADPDQASFEVDVVPVEPEELASAQARVGEESQQESVRSLFLSLDPVLIRRRARLVQVFGGCSS